ncbi:hypothetical protein D3C86_1314540 [compost metagenome]
MFAEADMVITGKSSKENLLKDGVFTSSGKSERMAFTFRCASFNEMSILALSVKVMVTVDKLSNETAFIFLMFSIDDTASSIFLVTVFSTSAGEAPG